MSSNKVTCHKAINLLVVFILWTLLLSGCGSKQIQKVEIGISDKSLNLVENAAPAKDYAFYVTSASVPQSSNDLQQFSLMACTGDGLANRAVQIGMGLGISHIGYGGASTVCMTAAMKNPKTVLVTKRSNTLPSDADLTEIVFK